MIEFAPDHRFLRILDERDPQAPTAPLDLHRISPGDDAVEDPIDVLP